MPRPDYDQLLALSEKIALPYKLVCFESNRGFRRSFAKLYDTRTTVKEKETERLGLGLWIDIFCVDGLGNDKEQAGKLHEHYIQACKQILFGSEPVTIRGQGLACKLSEMTL